MSAKGLSEHRALDAAMARFAVLMADPSDANLRLMARERMLFSRLFGRHMADERNALAAHVAKDAGIGGLALLADYDRRVAVLRADYSAHVNTWTPLAITARWRDYAAAVSRLQARLRELMAWEERTLPTLN